MLECLPLYVEVMPHKLSVIFIPSLYMVFLKDYSLSVHLRNVQGT